MLNDAILRKSSRANSAVPKVVRVAADFIDFCAVKFRLGFNTHGTHARTSTRPERQTGMAKSVAYLLVRADKCFHKYL